MSANTYPAPGEKLEDHPIAQIFPMMNTAERAELAESIKLRGLREPIVLLDGKILDGRNRLEACLAVGVQPRFRFYDYTKDGKSPTDYALDENLQRRHLTTSQRAAIAAEAMPFFEAEARERQRISGHVHAGNLRNATPPPAADDMDQRPPMDPADENQAPGAKSSRPGGAPGNRGASTPDQKKAPTKKTPTPAASSSGTPEPSKLSESAKKVAAETRDRYRDANGSKNHPPAGTTGTEPATRSPKSGDTPPQKKKTTRPAGATPSTTATPSPAPVVPKPEEPSQVPQQSGRAAEVAAATVHVSPTLVKDAARILEENPAGFAAIKAGESTVNAEKSKLQEEQRKAQELQNAFQRIETVCGKSLADAAREGTRLKGRKEVIAYAMLTDEQMLQIRGLIDDGWLVGKALKYKLQTLSRTHRIGDLLTRAAANGGIYTLLVGDWEICVTKRKAAK